MSDLVEATCDSCGGSDDHPKFHVIGSTATGVGWETYHHDCAAALGHEKASAIVKTAEGAKGSDLRTLLADANSEVHAVVAELNQKEAERIDALNKRTLATTESAE